MRPAGPPHPIRSAAPLPDPVAVERAARDPGSGPRIVFLSGGSALRDLSRVLPRYTRNSVHLITPFDSGGSSARLREAFGMLAIGDLRNRLLALADDSAGAVRRALQFRLERDASRGELLARLRSLTSGTDPLLEDVPDPARKELSRLFGAFLERMPDDFDLRDASLGNLVLAERFLETGRLADAVAEVARLVGARGRVLPTTEANLHLRARLADGSEVVGQHRLTGKESPPLQSPIEELDLVSIDAGTGRVRPAQAAASPEALREIERADLLCFPMGSFYSSLLCNTLATGVGRSVARARCPKLYVPSTGRDPELVSTDIGRAAGLLVAALQRDAPGVAPTRLLDTVLLDEQPEVYGITPDESAITRLGIERRHCQLVTPGEHPHVDADRLARTLVSLALPPPTTEPE